MVATDAQAVKTEHLPSLLCNVIDNSQLVSCRSNPNGNLPQPRR